MPTSKQEIFYRDCFVPRNDEFTLYINYIALSGLGIFVIFLFHRAMPCAIVSYPFRVITKFEKVFGISPERAKYINMGQRPMINQTQLIPRPERA